MIQLYNMKALRLVNSIFSFTSASEPKSFVLVGPKPSNFFLPNQLLCRPITSEISETQHGFKVNYLINTYGFSPEDAISVSKRVRLESPKKAESVLALLRNHGTSQTQISKLVRKLLPKLDFFSFLSVSRVDHAKTLAYNKQDYAHL
ncbi:hypothetical protein D8674_030321 [Pyrus ussuriensis x Pyrus communis]|uniref:Uncharacterized protein n=1 Tax=Pyrus ussuriensis x Pyrus communis TaxID=2448454 RepID=A0A5N5EY00_9ROSA|nr:hypothetical protein D8674_030321 [Pyrus ussuriensis x Pyrus communis]